MQGRDNIRPIDYMKMIEAKWQDRWKRDRLFEADPDPSKKKFFITFPYPYVNAYPHLGGAFTVLRVDIMARFKRMKGYNVLFPQGWHATGGPIVAASLRVREGDEKQIKALMDMGVPREEIKKFEDPAYWVKFFTQGWRRDLERYGLSIDWRREFHTTSLNPYYSKFIEWQYLKLRDKGYVGKGEHPVVWCPKERKVVGDHDRPDEYAGISPQEAVIIKFRGEDGRIYPALTYRPETIFGVTNLWVNPDAVYLIAEVDGEEWVINSYMANELRDQKHKVEVKGRVNGRDVIGRIVVNPVTGKRVPILPASFVDPEIGTGVVMSVPAHAPYDYVALIELKDKREVLSQYGLDPGIVEELQPIPLIRVEGYSDIPARDAVVRRGVKSQDERDKLDEATKEVYAKEFHTGVLLDITGRWSGMLVKDAKDSIVEWMESSGYAIRIYTLPTRVYCRCGARTHVKLVSDQWFLLYSREDWKRLAHEAVDSMRFLPESVRKVFHEYIDWYKDWAFTHKGELGTRLPWDPDWVIESLSDSTIYMAYYTIAKYLQHPEKYGIKAEQLKPEVFDYIFLGVGDPGKVSESTGIPRELLEEMRREFEYWYPVDLRISGKDLIPNHLVFYIFHHVAIFPRDKWPRGIGVNGWVLLSGKRMSKSKGHFILLRQALEYWGADATRWAEVLGGADPGLEDANFEPKVAEKAAEELYTWIKFAEEWYGSGRDDWRRIDEWFESILNRTIKKVDELMENTMFKTALVEGYYNLQAAYRWYLRRSGGKPNRELLKKFIEVQTLLIAPIAPHTADEVWERIGKKGYASIHPWPTPDESKIREDLEVAERIVEELIEDAKNVLRLVKGRRMRIIVAAEWKYRFLEEVAKARSRGLNLRDSIREAIKNIPDKKAASRIAGLVSKRPEVLSLLIPRHIEMETLMDAREFIQEELRLDEVIIEEEENSQSPKAGQALPGKPGIHVEA